MAHKQLGLGETLGIRRDSESPITNIIARSHIQYSPKEPTSGSGPPARPPKHYFPTQNFFQRNQKAILVILLLILVIVIIVLIIRNRKKNRLIREFQSQQLVASRVDIHTDSPQKVTSSPMEERIDVKVKKESDEKVQNEEVPISSTEEAYINQ